MKPETKWELLLAINELMMSIAGFVSMIPEAMQSFNNVYKINYQLLTDIMKCTPNYAGTHQQTIRGNLKFLVL